MTKKELEEQIKEDIKSYLGTMAHEFPDQHTWRGNITEKFSDDVAQIVLNRLDSHTKEEGNLDE